MKSFGVEKSLDKLVRMYPLRRRQSSGVTDQYESLDGCAPAGGDAIW